MQKLLRTLVLSTLTTYLPVSMAEDVYTESFIHYGQELKKITGETYLSQAWNGYTISYLDD
ncbi:MAG: hypothetical protein JXK16_12565 [Thiotrichales bacterium]|nr:hypothetical protein [Thiotrichales bacterium]